MKPGIRSAAGAVLAAAALAGAPGARAAEIVLEHTAFDKLLLQTLFKDDGRHILKPAPCTSYLETPTSTIKDGRIFIRSMIHAKLGLPAGGLCIGTTASSWTVVSGQPAVEDGVVRLQDIRVEEVEDSKLRFLLNSGLAPKLPSAVQLDLRKSIGSMLKSFAPTMEAEIGMLNIDEVKAEDDKLAVHFDFKLSAK